MEFDLFPFEEGLESQAEEAWDGEAELREDEDEVESKGWVPEGFTEILVPEMLSHHCELFIAVVVKLLGVILQPQDRVLKLVAEDLDWARELVKNVAEVLAMCWSAARTDGYPEGHPDALKYAGQHLEWAISKGVVSWEELTDAYWLSVLHSSPGAGDSPEDKLFWGIARKLSARQYRAAPIGSDPTVSVEGPRPEDAKLVAVARPVPERAWRKRSFSSIREFIRALHEYQAADPEFLPQSYFKVVWDQPGDPETIDDTFELSRSEVPTTNGRVDNIRVSDYMVRHVCPLTGATCLSTAHTDPRRIMFQWKFVEGKSSKFWVGWGDTEKALFKAVQNMAESTPRRTGRYELELKLGLHSIKVKISSNPKAPAVFALPASELMRIQFGLTDRWGNLRDVGHFLTLQMVEAGMPSCGVNPTVATEMDLMAGCLRGEVKDIHVAVWGRVVTEWRAMLGFSPPPAGSAPANQLPPITLPTTCRVCGKTGKVVYADGKCPTCHRADNPL